VQRHGETKKEDKRRLAYRLSQLFTPGWKFYKGDIPDGFMA
jgi:hypothetical protein